MEDVGDEEDDIKRWCWLSSSNTPDDEKAALLGLLPLLVLVLRMMSSFKIALESLSDDPVHWTIDRTPTIECIVPISRFCLSYSTES